MNRDELQEAAAKRLFHSKRLICQWATGCGKSRIALRFLEEHPEFRCLILVPEQDNIKNWLDEFDKFGIPSINVTIICYASLHKYKGTSWDVVVFDEVPHVDTEKRTAICKALKGDYILALGAVVTEEERQTLEQVYGEFDMSVVSLSRAISLGLLPAPLINVLHLQLDDNAKIYWYKGATYTDKGYYQILTSLVDKAVSAFNANPNNKFLKMRMLRAGNERKRFLGSRKDQAILRICQELDKKGKRYICFCSSIKQAETLGGDNAYTSKSPKSMEHLRRFNNHEINSLFVVGKLIEGQNLNDIECGIIGQLGGTQRITVQELGRVFRSKKPVVYIPVFDESKDDSFLYTLTASIPEEYIKHYNF